MQLDFASKEDAIAFCEKNRWNWEVEVFFNCLFCHIPVMFRKNRFDKLNRRATDGITHGTSGAAIPPNNLATSHFFY